MQRVFFFCRAFARRRGQREIQSEKEAHLHFAQKRFPIRIGSVVKKRKHRKKKQEPAALERTQRVDEQKIPETKKIRNTSNQVKTGLTL